MQLYAWGMYNASRSPNEFAGTLEQHLPYYRQLTGVGSCIAVWLYSIYSLQAWSCLRLTRKTKMESSPAWYNHPLLIWLVVWGPPIAIIVTTFCLAAKDSAITKLAARAADKLQAGLVAGNVAEIAMEGISLLCASRSVAGPSHAHIFLTQAV